MEFLIYVLIGVVTGAMGFPAWDPETGFNIKNIAIILCCNVIAFCLIRIAKNKN